jgi:putative transposase
LKNSILQILKKNSILEQVKIFVGETSNCPHNIKTICNQFGVSRSSLYYRSKLDQSESNQELIQLIIQLQLEHPCYGSDRIQLALKLNYQLTVNLKKVIRLRHKLNLTATTRKKKQGIRDRKLEDQSPITPNHFKTTFEDGNPKLLTKPNQIWVADFTYLWLPQLSQFLYVSTILDSFTREVLAVKISFNHNTTLVLQTLQLAILIYKAPNYFHSDQGSEYQAGEFKAYLKANNIIQSFAAKASPWQNGRQESFYNNFKLELQNPSDYVQQTTTSQLSYTAKTSLTQIEDQITQQIFYYNHQRIHTSIRTYPHLKRLEFNSSNHTPNQREFCV